MKDTTRWIRIPDEVDDLVRKKAEKEDRSIAYILQKIILNFFKNGKK